MGEGDFMPTGRAHYKADPKRIQKIKEGGKRAQVIKKQMETQHHQEEIPSAEQQLLQDLKTFNE